MFPNPSKALENLLLLIVFVSACGTVSSYDCIAQTCDTCTIDNNCGWCVTDGVCYFGNATGVSPLVNSAPSSCIQGNKGSWYVGTCPGIKRKEGGEKNNSYSFK